MSRDRSRRSGDDPSLAGVRHQIEALAVPNGRFRVACARDGTSPVPVDGLAFADREVAAVAAVLAEWYRERLRRWDERTPRCDLVVHDGSARLTEKLDDDIIQEYAEANT